jgi:hypothetical protein
VANRGTCIGLGYPVGMIELKLTRDTFTATSTTGILLYNGDPFGYVLEDPDRGLDASDPATLSRKIRKETCIPVGRYRVECVWSPSRGKFTPRLMDVPGFQGILVHTGNRPEDSEGCLLPGLSRGPDVVNNSTRAYTWLYPRLRDADEVWITIERDAGAWVGAVFNPLRAATAA